MRTLFLYGLADPLGTAAYLDSVLPSQSDGEWTLGDEQRTFAWLRIDANPELLGDESDKFIEPGPCLVADLSGAMPDRKPDLIAFLRGVQSSNGGTLRDDNDTPL